MPRCKNCKDKFNAKVFNQKFCLKDECIKISIDLMLKKVRENKKKEWNKEKKERKERLKTKGDYLKEVQTVFNKWIRLRDNGLNCISCKKKCKKENAGHYRSVGSSPELRFEPLNVHLQCEYCNTYLHGNLINYRINLIKKIGIKNVEWLESNHNVKRYNIDDLIKLKEYYKKKIKELNK